MVHICRYITVHFERFADVKHRKALGEMDQALEDLTVLAAGLPQEETSLKVKCLLKVMRKNIPSVLVKRCFDPDSYILVYIVGFFFQFTSGT